MDQQYFTETLLTRAGGHEKFINTMGYTIGRSIEYVCDGDEFDDLEACQKTYIGTKVEKTMIKYFDLPSKKSIPKPILDTIVAGVHVDIKFTVGNNWMIPPEAAGHWCILIRANVKDEQFSLGILPMTEHNLTKGSNRDRKRSISANGRANIKWICQQSPIVFESQQHDG